MQTFEAKPYKLFNKIQNYDWGTKNENAFIPNFLGIKAEPNLPYAELWIGAHPKASSEIEIEGKKIPLNKIIEEYPIECLGKEVSEKYNGRFPFLLKVLSAAQALSIQTHPNKIQAEKLHAKDPKNYPDDNHKPEIAIAVDSLIAIAGFKPVEEIISNLRETPEFEDFIGKELLEKVFSSGNDNESAVKNLYAEMMKKSNDEEKLSKCILKICGRLNSKNELTVSESQFLMQHELYGNDIGLLSFFFFNIIELKSGQAIFTDAGVPHAYIKGNIIECMANSDNVVRAGLTNKFKDVDTLLEILRCDFEKFETINDEQKKDEVIYKTGAKEFEVAAYSKKKDFMKIYKSNNRPQVFLIADGEIQIDCGTKSQIFKKGESFFIPASLSEYRVTVAEESKYYLINIPE
jgi:mannose-6-phosphate isomerase